MELLGKILGTYQIDHLLGESGMRGVYHAYDLSLQREIAIKMIHPHLGRLNHPGFIQGGDLRELLDQLIAEGKWLPLNEAVLLVQQLCQTVVYSYQHHILHRHIKAQLYVTKTSNSFLVAMEWKS